MVAPSKLFVHPLKCYHCSQLLLHPGVGCFRNFLNNLLVHGLSGLKYFSPLLITPLVLNYKTIDIDQFIHTVKHYFQTVVAASLATASTLFYVCCLRNLLGDFRLYTTLFLPTVLGLQFCWFFPRRVVKLFTTATSQAVLEGLLLQYSNKFTHLILYSPMIQTILFMLNSAIVLHYKRKNIYKDFWFIQPHEKVIETITTNNYNKEIAVNPDIEGAEKSNNNSQFKAKCDHSNSISCGTFVIDGIKSYMLYGIPLDLLNMLMGEKSIQKSQGLVQKVVERCKAFRPSMTGFFVSYIGIYRLSFCLMRKYYNHLSVDLQHVLSAFLAGSSFIFAKRTNFMTLSLIISTQLLWQQFCNWLKNKKSERKANFWLKVLKYLTISQMILPINCGYLVHNYILNYHLVNSLARGFLDGITNDKAKHIRDDLRNNDVQSLLKMAKAYSVRTFF